MRAFLGLVLALAIATPSAAAAQEVAEFVSIERIERELRRYSATGGTIAIVLGQRVIVQAVGHTDVQRATPVTPDRLFGSSGLPELFTALVAAGAAANGAVDLHAPVRTYAADLPERVGGVTLAQLLAHTAGLDDAEPERGRRRRTGPDVWPDATDRALFTRPGAIHSPSRYGLPLVQAILATRLGRPFDALLSDLVLAPAGLDRTTSSGARAQSLGAVPGHVVVTTGQAPQRAFTPNENPQPQLWTTAGDLGNLLALWMNGGSAGGRARLPAAVFDTVARSRAVRPANPHDSIAFGLRVSRFLGQRQLDYAGGIAGYGTLLRWLPDRRIGVVVLGNATGAVLHAVADSVLTRALGLVADTVAPASPEPTAMTTPGPRALAGTYENGDRIIGLELQGNELYWRDGDIVLPAHISANRIEVIVPDGRIAQVLHVWTDRFGQTYVIAGERAYRKR